MRYLSLCVGVLLLISSGLTAAPRWGVEVVPHTTSIGLLCYDTGFGGGISIGSSADNAAAKTALTRIGFFVEKRDLVSDDMMMLTYGIDAYTLSGTDAGVTLDKGYGYGPFIGFEKPLANRILLSVWTLPISFHTVAKAGVSVDTVKYFDSGLGVSYWF
ncbi:MAG: hypothetical protein AB7F28_00815 [Candidatus Margulisiibacteriota bacterium]